MELVHSGKVRDVYADGDDLILVASDRVSVYDVVLPTPIPDKGAILTQLSLWWFEQLADVVPNHVISGTDVPAEWAGRAIRCRRLDMVPVECIARGYLAGLGPAGVRRAGAVSGVRAAAPGWSRAPGCPSRSSRRPPRRPVGEHDEFITFDDVVGEVGAETAERAARHHPRGLPARRGDRRASAASSSPTPRSSSAGRRTARLVLADEVLTPDSSRFWPADEWTAGRPAARRSTSSSSATGRPRHRLGQDASGPADPRRRRRRHPHAGTSRSTSGSPAHRGVPERPAVEGLVPHLGAQVTLDEVDLTGRPRGPLVGPQRLDDRPQIER